MTFPVVIGVAGFLFGGLMGAVAAIAIYAVVLGLIAAASSLWD